MPSKIGKDKKGRDILLPDKDKLEGKFRGPAKDKGINIIFAADEPGSPGLVFVEVHDDSDKSVRIGEWSRTDDWEYQVLRITAKDIEDVIKANEGG